LTTEYLKNENVNVVVSENNLGFAKGNNLGCEHAIRHYNPEFLIVINNDTYIEQQNFLDEIEKEYLKEKFHILGPYIYDRNLKPQNPNPGLKTTLEEIERRILKCEYSLKKLEEKSTYEEIKKILERNKVKIKRSIRKIFKKEKKSRREKLADKKIRDIGLHGSALIFSKKYYEKYNDVFYPKTFMFVEEDILYYRVKRDKLISVYSPSIKIFHKEDSSTEAVLKSEIEKKFFILKNSIDSLNIFKEMIKKGETK